MSLTKLNNEIIKLSKNNNSDLNKLYKLFLENTFYILARKKGADYYPILSKNDNKKINFVLFEKKSYSKEWHELSNPKIPRDVYILKMRGDSFVEDVYKNNAGNLEVYLYFKKDTYFTFSSEMMQDLLKMI